MARILQDIINTIYDTFLIFLMLWFGDFVIQGYLKKCILSVDVVYHIYCHF
jgi:hypothetical protein